MTQLEQELRDFGNRLDWYIDYKKIPKEWFGHPDYATIVAANITDLQQLVEAPRKERVFINPEQEDRFDISAKLAGALSIGKVGHLRWVEILEPSKEEQIAGAIGLQIMRFYCNDFEKSRYFLGARGIPHEIIEFDGHYEINVFFDPELNSFRLVNKHIEAITEERLSEGKIQELKRAA